MPMVLPMLAQAAAPAVPVASRDPVALFQEACLGAGARLGAGSAVSTSYGALPPGARTALGDVMPHAPGTPAAAPAEKDVPNQMFRMAGGDTYLVVPTSVAVPGAAFADACVVLWRGGDFAAAYKAALPSSAPTAGAAAKASGNASGTERGHDISVATSAGWTVLKSIPTPQPPVLDP